MLNMGLYLYYGYIPTCSDSVVFFFLLLCVFSDVEEFFSLCDPGEYTELCVSVCVRGIWN